MITIFDRSHVSCIPLGQSRWHTPTLRISQKKFGSFLSGNYLYPQDSKPDDPDSDYETWAPSDGFKHKCKHGACGCLLGMQVAYVRRKQLHQCFNRRKTKLPVISQPCRCTQEDYECELDFVRALDQQSCVATVMPPPRARFGPSEQRECEISKSYKVDMYRRVPGNRCSLTVIFFGQFSIEVASMVPLFQGFKLSCSA